LGTQGGGRGYGSSPKKKEGFRKEKPRLAKRFNTPDQGNTGLKNPHSVQKKMTPQKKGNKSAAADIVTSFGA